MNDALGGFLAGTIFALIFAIFLVETGPLGETFDQKKSLIQECEIELPRTEHCVLIAVPEKDKDNGEP